MRRFCTIMILLTIAQGSMATNIRAIANGNWVLPETWSCNCTPVKGDNVVIPAGVTVIVTRPVTANVVVLTIAGELDITNGALQMGPGDQVVIMPGGRIISNGLGGVVYIGITPHVLRSGTTLEGPFTIGDGGFPVALMFFEAEADIENDFVTLTWASAGELNIDSYNILHSNDSINFTNVGTMKGLGYSLRRHDYSYRVSSRSLERKFFRLEATAIDSTRIVLSTVRVNTEQ